MPIIKTGKYTYGTEHITEINFGEPYNIEIGSFCSIAQNVTIFTGGNHRTDWITTFPFGHKNQDIFNNFDGKGHPHSKGNVIIGNDVWIGRGTHIMSGVTIGDGAVIAANSHVVNNIPPYTIYGGNPARFIKYRFNKEHIEHLLKLKWWDMSDTEINNILPILCSSSINNLIFKD